MSAQVFHFRGDLFLQSAEGEAELYVPFDDDFRPSGFTFEIDPEYVDPDGFHTGFNPLHFATAGTAEKVLKFFEEVVKEFDGAVTVSVEQSTAPGYTVPQRAIRVALGNKSELFNAGLKAAALAKVSRQWVKASTRDEIAYFLRAQAKE